MLPLQKGHQALYQPGGKWWEDPSNSAEAAVAESQSSGLGVGAALS